MKSLKMSLTAHHPIEFGMSPRTIEVTAYEWLCMLSYLGHIRREEKRITIPDERFYTEAGYLEHGGDIPK